MLEEGLLAILNGQTDKRFELDHAELGGLAFRIDQLLNQLMGVEEDTTDEEGRVSEAPSAAHFNDAMAVDDKRRSASGRSTPTQPRASRRGRRRSTTRASTASTSRPRRRSASRPTTSPSRRSQARIQGMEQEAAQKYGRPVRYQVQARRTGGRPPRRPLAERAARTRSHRGSRAIAVAANGKMGLFDLFKEATSKAEQAAESSPAAKWAARGHAARSARRTTTGRRPSRHAAREMARRRDAVEALLKRFTFHMTPRSPIRRRRTRPSRASCAPGEDAIEPVRAFAAKAESLAWPMKILKELVDEDEYVESSSRWLSNAGTPSTPSSSTRRCRSSSRSRSTRHPSIRAAVERFLEDVNEPARFHAVRRRSSPRRTPRGDRRSSRTCSATRRASACATRSPTASSRAAGRSPTTSASAEACRRRASLAAGALRSQTREQAQWRRRVEARKALSVRRLARYSLERALTR